ncbi:hypothetical protein UB31_16660 [Bradyrhizobium sp. LTSP849]|jgi:hypothetical protein|nr:hypothetical protein UB31_16660 [Bradyrhizobium sp. LTSP849]
MSRSLLEKEYSERYVAFLDILGFSNIVSTSVASKESTATLIAAVETIGELQKQYDSLKSDDFRAQTFSDCIVMSEKASPLGLVHLLAATTHAALSLLEIGIFIRGGFAKGLLYHSDQVVLGPAMIRAYQLESSIARYPRILVDQSTHQDSCTDAFQKAATGWSISPRIALAEDGPPFVDIFDLTRDPAVFENGLEDIEKIQKVIETELHKSIYIPAHYEKLRWLAIYWNSVSAEFNRPLVKFPHQSA